MPLDFSIWVFDADTNIIRDQQANEVHDVLPGYELKYLRSDGPKTIPVKVKVISVGGEKVEIKNMPYSIYEIKYRTALKRGFFNQIITREVIVVLDKCLCNKQNFDDYVIDISQ